MEVVVYGAVEMFSPSHLMMIIVFKKLFVKCCDKNTDNAPVSFKIFNAKNRTIQDLVTKIIILLICPSPSAPSLFCLFQPWPPQPRAA